VLASYLYKDIRQVFDVQDYPGGFAIQDCLYGRLHLFASESKNDILRKIFDHSSNFIGIGLEQPKPLKFDQFVQHKFGKFSEDLYITSISEFTVYKQSRRHQDPVRRLLCITETCLIERDPSTYSIVSLKPLSAISALIRHIENTQLFSIQYVNGDVRSYTSTERDSLLASFLDGVRGSGNRDVHVRMSWMELGKRLCPLDCLAEEEVEATHLR
jgi:DnaJ family protein C protein 13